MDILGKPWTAGKNNALGGKAFILFFEKPDGPGNGSDGGSVTENPDAPWMPGRVWRQLMK